MPIVNDLSLGVVYVDNNEEEGLFVCCWLDRLTGHTTLGFFLYTAVTKHDIMSSRSEFNLKKTSKMTKNDFCIFINIISRNKYFSIF